MKICLEFTQPNNRYVATLHFDANNAPESTLIEQFDENEYITTRYKYYETAIILLVYAGRGRSIRLLKAYVFIGNDFIGIYKSEEDAKSAADTALQAGQVP